MQDVHIVSSCIRWGGPLEIYLQQMEVRFLPRAGNFWCLVRVVRQHMFSKQC